MIPLASGPAAPPRKLPVWAIVLIVLLLLCCCCVGLLGLAFAFWDPISQELRLAFILPLLGTI